MTITMKDFIKQLPKNENDLYRISGEIWDLDNSGGESLDSIKNQISPELFNAFMGIETLGVWQGDGWGGIIENTNFIPYISQALNLFGASKEIELAFQDVYNLFQNVVKFCDGNVRLYDVMDFLTSTLVVPTNQGLKKYSKEEHAQLEKDYHAKLDKLENLPIDDVLWVENVLSYIKQNH